MNRTAHILIAQAKDAALQAARKRESTNADFERRIKGIDSDYRPEVSARKTAEARMERDAVISASETEAETFINEIFTELEGQLQAVAAEPVPDGFWNTVKVIEASDLSDKERDIVIDPYRGNFICYRYIGTHYGSTDAAAYNPSAPRYKYDDVIERLNQLKAGFIRASKGTDRVFQTLMERDGYAKDASEVFEKFAAHEFAESGRLLKQTNVNGR